MKAGRTDSTRALTVIELLIIVAVLSVLAPMFVLGSRPKCRCTRINCVNNLKQIGLSFRTWSLDNNDHFPMQTSITNGGAMELAGNNIPLMYFMVMSNELSTPRVLFCPADNARTNSLNAWQDLKNRYISYFVGLEATDTNPQMFLCGDRNLTNGLPIKNHILEVPTNRPVGWTHQIHLDQGNIALADGSVQAFNTSRLRQALTSGGAATNRLAMP